MLFHYYSLYFSSEKCPTIAVPSFFVRPSSSPGMYHFLCIMHFYQKYLLLDFERIQKPLTWKTKAKGPPYLFFRQYETSLPFFDFVRFFSMSPKGPPFECFWYFATGWMLINPKRSPFTFFGTLHFPKKFQVFQKKVLRILSLRYSADFRRSPLLVCQSHSEWSTFLPLHYALVP